MEGVVDPIFREVLTSAGGIDVCVTEFLRITEELLPDKVFYRHAPELKSGSVTTSGIPVHFQLLGGKPEPMAQNALKAVSLGACAIDLNFGCPAKTVNRHDGGAALLKEPNRIFEVSSAVRRSVPIEIPVSAKIRLGYEDKSYFLEIAHAAQDAGVSHLTVHARTKMEAYRPPAHWEYIARIRESLSIPVVANGEIWTVQDFERCREITGCTDFMLGRGLIADPFLARKCKGKIQEPSDELVLELADKVIEMSERLFTTHYALARWKQWLRYLSLNSELFKKIFEQDKTLRPIDLPNGGLLQYFRERYRESDDQEDNRTYRLLGPLQAY